MKEIKIIRIIFSIFVLALTLLFFFHKNIPGTDLHFYEKAAQFVINLQILPALLSLAFIYITAIIIITIICGRVICSAFCPLGIYNDLISRLGAKIRKKNFHYKQKLNLFKYIILFAVIILSALGLSAYTGLLEPFSIFGKISAYFFVPIFSNVENAFATVINKISGYSISHEDHSIDNLHYAIGFFFFFIITGLAFFRGRISPASSTNSSAT